MQIIKEAFARISRVAYLINPTWYPQYLVKSEMDTAARAIGIRLDTYQVDTLESLTNAFAEIRRRRTEAMVVSFSPLFATERQQIVDFVAKRRLPAIYGEAIFVEDGGLMFYGTPVWMGHAATVVAKILRGANPADIPVEQPTTFKLIINLKTARALGLTIPESILLRADKVIR